MTKQMGLGKLGKPGNIHAMKFRYEVISKHFPPEIVVKAHVDHIGKQIDITVRDVILENSVFDSLKWIDKLPSYTSDDETHNFKLVTYDGCGNPLYETTFEGLRLHGHNVSFDYESSEEIHRHLMLTFQSSKTVIAARFQPPTCEIKKAEKYHAYFTGAVEKEVEDKLLPCRGQILEPGEEWVKPHWEIDVFNNKNKTIVQKQKIHNIKRPNVGLNGEWEKLDFNLSIEDSLKFSPLLYTDNDNTVVMYLVQKDRALEYWKLFGARIIAIPASGHITMRIIYKKVTYHPTPEKHDFTIKESDL